MATVTQSRTTAPAPTTIRWAPFRSLLEEHRAEWVRQRELALADTVASVQDPVAMARSAQILRTIEEIDAALARVEAGTYRRGGSFQAALPGGRLGVPALAA